MIAMCKNCGPSKPGQDRNRCFRCGAPLAIAAMTIALTMPFAKPDIRHPDDETAPAPYVNMLVQSGPAIFAAQRAVSSNSVPFFQGSGPQYHLPWGWPAAVDQSQGSGTLLPSEYLPDDHA
jgi:hypothetical protein